jgi:glutaconate CoA-transferase subunit B
VNGELEANTIVALLARQLPEHSVVATGVASPLAILAIAVASSTHAPNLSYLSCVGSLDPALTHLHRSSEALQYLEGRRAEVSIADLFDHARRNRVDTVFFGAAEVDGFGRTNMSAAGSLEQPTAKFPGVAGASSLRRWAKRPVLLMMKHSKRSLVPAVQVASTSDPQRRTMLITNFAIFEVGTSGAVLVGRHPWATEATIAEKTGFSYETAVSLPVTELASDDTARAIRSIDVHNLRQTLVG